LFADFAHKTRKKIRLAAGCRTEELCGIGLISERKTKANLSGDEMSLLSGKLDVPGRNFQPEAIHYRNDKVVSLT